MRRKHLENIIYHIKMTQEDKELLLKDLSARLPYGVKINVNGEEDTLLELGVDTGWVNASYDIEEVKPYLRPMSSMTEKERNEYFNIIKNSIEFYNCPKSEDICFLIVPIDWLLAHHFDYRGLIEKGLAIKVTKENNPYKE